MINNGSSTTIREHGPVCQSKSKHSNTQCDHGKQLYLLGFSFTFAAVAEEEAAEAEDAGHDGDANGDEREAAGSAGFCSLSLLVSWVDLAVPPIMNAQPSLPFPVGKDDDDPASFCSSKCVSTMASPRRALVAPSKKQAALKEAEREGQRRGHIPGQICWTSSSVGMRLVRPSSNFLSSLSSYMHTPSSDGHRNMRLTTA